MRIRFYLIIKYTTFGTLLFVTDKSIRSLNKMDSCHTKVKIQSKIQHRLKSTEFTHLLLHIYIQLEISNYIKVIDKIKYKKHRLSYYVFYPVLY